MAIILIVDDSPTVRRVLGFTLRQNNHTVLSATNGQEALDLLGTTDVDLVIADVSMPELDGIALLRHLRANKRTHDLPVVMLTASGQNQDRILAEEAGANGFLTKPASSLELRTIVNKFTTPR